jgi:nitroreductase
MTREFDPARPVSDELLERLVDLAARSPSAGKTQGWHLVVLRGAQTSRFWDVTLPVPARAGFAWPGLLAAPVIALPLADPQAYLTRYAEPDKQFTGWGGSTARWSAPYWTIDAAMAVMTLLLAAQAEGLGTLLFAVARGAEELRGALGIPEEMELLGAVAIGWPAPAPSGRRGASAARRRRSPAEIVHYGHW